MNTGITLNANYTWSHSIDNLSSAFSEDKLDNNLGYLDPFNPRLDAGNSNTDARHRVVLSGIWDVPLGKNSTGAEAGNRWLAVRAHLHGTHRLSLYDLRLL